MEMILTLKKKREKKRKAGFIIQKVNRINLIPTSKKEYDFKRMKLKTRRESTQRF